MKKIKKKKIPKENADKINELDAVILSDVGKRRGKNEDSGIIRPYHIIAEKGEFDTEILLIADGMGGHNAGEVASGIALRSIIISFARAFGDVKTSADGLLSSMVGGGVFVLDSRKKRKVLKKVTPKPLNKSLPINDIVKNAILNSIETANNVIHEKAQSEPDYEGMGTTVTMCVIVENTAIFCNVGDSRTYIVRENNIRRVTKDHSYVQTLVDMGEVTEEEAFDHPQKNIITKALGLKETVKADIFEEKLIPGDIIILCSDGLHDMLRDKEILDYVLSAKSANEACKVLVDKANEKGGKDNITVAVAKYG